MSNLARQKGLKGLGYYGGKSPFSVQQTGQWIVSLMPKDTDTCYIEPFFGMGGVLLNKPKSRIEIVNDLNHRLWNWWKCVRDHPVIFSHIIQNTPISRKAFEDAIDLVDDMTLTSLQRGIAYHTVILQNMKQGDGGLSKGNWKRQFTTQSARPWPYGRVAALADRIRLVQIENTDAIKLLERTASIEDAVLYVDPPYPSADTSAYLHNVDLDGLAAVLKKQKGKVLVSGYRGEWDALSGWHEEEHVTHRATVVKGKNKVSKRIEVIWTNYDPITQPSMFDIGAYEEQEGESEE